MKKIILILWACISLLGVSFTPAKAQVTGFSLDFTGGSGNCDIWIDSVGGGWLDAFHDVGVPPTIVASSNAGGALPECAGSTSAGLGIQLVGFRTSSLSVTTSGGVRIDLYSDGATCSCTLVYRVTTASPGTVNISGIDYDLAYFYGPAGTYFDNIIIGTLGGANAPRLNGGDWSAPVALYCTAGGGLDVYDIVGDQGVFAHRISDQAIANGIDAAASSGHNERIMNTPTTDLWILSTGEVQVNSGSYVSQFVYQNACGALPEPTIVPDVVDENRDVIIDEPR